MDRKSPPRCVRRLLMVAPIAVAVQLLGLGALSAQAPSGTRCDSVQYRFVDAEAPTTARHYRYAQPGQSYALRDSIVLDGHDIVGIEVQRGLFGTDTTWTVMARFTPAGASALTAATASHIGSMIAVLVGDEIVQTAIIQGSLRTALLPVQMDLSRRAADSLAARLRRTTGCTK